MQRFGYDGWDTAQPSPIGTENFNVWADLDGSNTLTSWRAFGPGFDQPVAVVAAGSSAVDWYLADNLGSVRQVVSSSGSVDGSATYDAFGSLTAGTPFDRYGYTGYQWDSATGLWDANARYYDASTHRFLSEDPEEFAAGDVNLYRYVGNGPTDGVDPSGRVIVTRDENQANQFMGDLIKNGANSNRVTITKIGSLFYVHTDDRDYISIYRVAKGVVNNNLKRNMLIASGVVGEVNVEYFFAQPNGNKIELSDEEKKQLIQERKKKIGTYKPRNVIIDLAGEGRYFLAGVPSLNLDESNRTTSTSFPPLMQIPGLLGPTIVRREDLEPLCDVNLAGDRQLIPLKIPGSGLNLHDYFAPGSIDRIILERPPEILFREAFTKTIYKNKFLKEGGTLALTIGSASAGNQLYQALKSQFEAAYPDLDPTKYITVNPAPDKQGIVREPASATIVPYTNDKERLYTWTFTITYPKK